MNLSGWFHPFLFFNCAWTSSRALKLFHINWAEQRRSILALLAGGLLAAAYAPLNQAWLAWLAPGLMLFLAAGTTGTSAFRLGFHAGLGFHLSSLYWLLLVPMPVHAAAAWLAVGSYLGLYPALWCWICWRCFPRGKLPVHSSGLVTSGVECLLSLSRGQRIAWAAFCAVAWVAMEMVMARMPTLGFAWNLLGVSQHKFLPLVQIASVSGVFGVSFLVAWTSVALACAVLVAVRSPRKSSAVAQEVSLPLLAGAGAVLFGLMKLSGIEPAHATLRLALIQPSIPQPVIWDANEKTNRFNKLLELSETALAQKADLLVWPEAALPDLLSRTRATQETVTALVRRHNVWMVFGGDDTGRKRNAAGVEEVHRFNTAFFVSPTGDLISRYHKRRLVAFTEYMPAVRWLPFLKYLRETGAGFEAGRHLVPFRITSPPATASVLICFEDVFPHLARESVNGDTDFLLNLTNDAWCGESATQWQHAVSAAFRAVENGVPLVRCTNNGLTCWVDARGRMHEIHFPDTRNIYLPGYKLVNLPLRGATGARDRTIYNRFGDWFGWACLGITAAALLDLFLRRRDRPV